MNLFKNLFTGEEKAVTSLCMDNFHIDLTARGKEALTLALKIVLMDHTPTHWCRHPKAGLVLFWHHRPEFPIKYTEWGPTTEKGASSRDVTIDVHPFPCRIKRAEDLAMFVEGWLSEQVYPPEPDLDGSCSKGFRIYNERYGRVGGCGDYSFIAIQPEWAEHHK